jgi:hypothetical protein
VPWALETRTLRPDPPPVFPDRHGKRRHEWDGVIGGGAAGGRTSRGLVQVSAIDRRYESACTRRPESPWCPLSIDPSGTACASWWRETMLSLAKTLRRW